MKPDQRSREDLPHMVLDMEAQDCDRHNPPDETTFPIRARADGNRDGSMMTLSAPLFDWTRDCQRVKLAGG